VFGGIDRDSKECFLIALPQQQARTGETLMAAIEEKIAPGSDIITDCWAGYNELQDHPDYTHWRVNHTYNFLNPDHQDVHTQTIERLWRSAKFRNKKQSGTNRNMLDSYLCEFMWRHDVKRRNADPFNEILSHIVAYWPPQ
jgi:transposase-like protein